MFNDKPIELKEVDDFLVLIKRLLWENKMSQSELATRTGITVQTINSYVNGRTTPLLRNAILMLNALGYTIKVEKKW